MDFNVKRENPVLKKEKEDFKEKELDIAYKFSKAMISEFKDFIKSIVVFGSSARKKERNQGDIDILIILDDVQIQFSKPIVQGYRVLTQKIISNVSEKLHITTMRLSNFWEYVRIGDPIAVNILRDGFPVYDTGIFTPVKLLLYQGRIRPSKESIHNYIARSKHSLLSSKNHILAACIDLYWSVIDAAEAALIKVNEVPPSPAHVHNLIEKRFVETGVIEKRYSIILHEFYHLNKSIEHKEITYVPADQYQEYLHEAEDFVDCMQKIIDGKLN